MDVKDYEVLIQKRLVLFCRLVGNLISWSYRQIRWILIFIWASIISLQIEFIDAHNLPYKPFECRTIILKIIKNKKILILIFYHIITNIESCTLHVPFSLVLNINALLFQILLFLFKLRWVHKIDPHALINSDFSKEHNNIQSLYHKPSTNSTTNSNL